MLTSLADLVLVHGDVGRIRVYWGVLLQEFVQAFEIRLFQQFFDFECRFVQDDVQILDKMRVGIYLFPVSGEDGNPLVGIVEMTEKFLLFHVDLLVALF